MLLVLDLGKQPLHPDPDPGDHWSSTMDPPQEK